MDVCVLVSHTPGFYFVFFSFLFSRCFLQMHRMHDLFALGSGEAMLQLVPPFQCRRHCHSMAVPLAPGDIGYAGAAHWKVYVVARGVQPLVVCDATTLAEP